MRMRLIIIASSSQTFVLVFVSQILYNYIGATMSGRRLAL